eukprot:7582528-Pyramimonas_sp.AAC.1
MMSSRCRSRGPSDGIAASSSRIGGTSSPRRGVAQRGGERGIMDLVPLAMRSQALVITNRRRR